MTSKIFKALLVALTILFGGAGILRAMSSNTYGILTETYQGVDISSWTWPTSDPERAYLGVWAYPYGCTFMTLSNDTMTFTEGSQSLKVVTSTANAGTSGGYYINFGSSTYEMDRDFSAYSNGTLEFDIKLDKSVSNTRPQDVYVGVEWNHSSGKAAGVAAASDNMTLIGYGIADQAGWQHCSIPLGDFWCSDYDWTGDDWAFVGQSINDIENGTTWGDGINCLSVVSMFSMTAPKMFWIDNVVFQNDTTGSIGITVRNRSDNSIVSNGNITWSGINLGTTKWKAADQYIEVTTDYYYPPGWGIQIYTDNKASDANPKYTGTGNPVGLIDASTTTKTLPMAWRIVSATTTALTIQQGMTQGTTSYPTRLWVSELGNTFPCFLWMEDKNTVANSTTSTAGYTPGGSYWTVWDTFGIQYGEYSFGASKSPNYIYLGANFQSALTPRTYTTNKLKIELFNE